ncbi:cysteine desulfurase family protein [Bacteroidota bacterium]
MAPEVYEAMLPYLEENFGNASSIHTFGKTAKVILEDARDLIANFLGAKPKEIFFTSGGTESNNFAIKGLSYRFLNSDKNHIITTTVEHSAVIEIVNYLKDRFGFRVTFVKPDKDGNIISDSIQNEIIPETFLISVMHSNNETGVINDIKALANIAKEKEIFLHSDTVQSIGKTEFDLKKLNIDFATLSAHKFYGPKGVGIAYIKEGTIVDKFIHGGGQERDMRGGTENIAGVVGLMKAVELLKQNFSNDVDHYVELGNYLIKKLEEVFNDKIIFNSRIKNSLPNIVNVSFKPDEFNFDYEMFLIMLDLKGIAVSSGSACTSGSIKPSRVLLEMGRDERTALSSLRISFGRDNTLDEVDHFITALKEIVK